MLVLTRRIEEKIVIGDEDHQVTITILKIQGDRVSIGIKADPNTPILRHELIEEQTPTPTAK